MARSVGFVAFLDVLGFADLMSREDHEQRLEEYFSAVSTYGSAEGASGLQHVLFSDSIVINTTSLGVESFGLLARNCSRLAGLLITRGVAVRGAIAHGTFSRSSGTNGTIVAGAPIIDAYRREQEQEWVGISLCPRVLDAVPLEELCALVENVGNVGDSSRQAKIKANLPLLLHVQQALIPLRGGTAFEDHSVEGYAIVPSDASLETPQSLFYSVDRIDKALQRMKLRAPDARAQKKYVAAQEFLRKVAFRWQVLNNYGFEQFIAAAGDAGSDLGP